MKIIEWLNSSFDISYAFIAFVIWVVLWNLINLITSKILKKCDLNYDLMRMGPILGSMASFGIAVFLSLILLLLVASIQLAIEYGIKLAFPLLIFWGGIIAFVIFFIKKIRNK